MMDKYDWSRQDAEELAGFLAPMLDYVPDKRATAAQCLKHPWLQNIEGRTIDDDIEVVAKKQDSPLSTPSEPPQQELINESCVEDQVDITAVGYAKDGE